MPQVPVQPLTPTSPSYVATTSGQVWWCRGPQPVGFNINGTSYLASIKSGLVTSPYATVDDVYAISVPDDQRFDYAASTIATWLSIGAAKVNEFLGQRFQVPLTVWSDTVVWANCELTYIKTGRWIADRGGLSSPMTNQQFIDLRTGKNLNHLFIQGN